jgi:hypothetical protein
MRPDCSRCDRPFTSWHIVRQKEKFCALVRRPCGRAAEAKLPRVAEFGAAPRRIAEPHPPAMALIQLIVAQ